MTSVRVEHAQYVDDAGKPIVGGLMYIGTQNADPIATAAATLIYSDRELTAPIANPQPLGTDGRTINKVWVDGEYSIQVNSLIGVVETQEFQDLDAGVGAAAASTLEVTNVVGSNIITGTTAAALSALSANQQFIFTTVAANTAAVSLNIDGTGARQILKNKDQPVLNGEFEDNQVVIVAYNGENNNYEWTNQNNKVVDFYNSAVVASAATTDIWVTDGNTVHVSGSTTIENFGTAPSIGARRTVIFDGAVTIENSTEIPLPQGADFTTLPGDILQVYAETLTRVDVIISRQNGRAVFDDITAPGDAPKFAVRAWVKFNGTGTVAIYGSGGNVSSITDHGVGNYSVNYTIDMPDTDYSVSGMANRIGGVFNNIIAPDTVTPVYSVSSTRFLVTNGSSTPEDPDICTIQVVR